MEAPLEKRRLSYPECPYSQNARARFLKLYHVKPQLWKAEATKFVHKVNGLLRNHYGNRIKQFTVKFPLTSAHASELDQWIGFAAAASTEKLFLDLDYKHCKSSCWICRRGWNFASQPYDFLLLPFTEQRGCRLSELTLSNCSLGKEPTNLSGFSCLHSISLIVVSITDAVVSNIMSSCSALQSLNLEECDQLIYLTITHSQLLCLKFICCGSLINVCIHADNLEAFIYKARKVNIEYEYAPFLDTLYVYFVKKNECPLDFISALPTLPKLEMLALQFPTRLQVSRALQHTFRFAGLKGCNCKLPEPSELNMTWPEDLTLSRIDTIMMAGFSGEAELMQLLYFLLRRAPALKTLQLETSVLDQRFSGQKKHELQDEARCRYAREMATHLAPKVPSTVAFTIT